jgi:hypothetical protein
MFPLWTTGKLPINIDFASSPLSIPDAKQRVRLKGARARVLSIKVISSALYKSNVFIRST